MNTPFGGLFPQIRRHFGATDDIEAAGAVSASTSTYSMRQKCDLDRAQNR
jgi:hypothetical protein